MRKTDKCSSLFTQRYLILTILWVVSGKSLVVNILDSDSKESKEEEELEDGILPPASKEARRKY